MRSSLLVTSASHDVDVAVQAEGLARRSKRLVVLDVDSTLTQNEAVELTLNVVNRVWGREEAVQVIEDGMEEL